MISPVFFAAGTALLMVGLLVEAGIFRALHDDPPSTYKLYALRDKLVHLVVEGIITHDDPHFRALYRDVNVLLKGCRLLSRPDGWRLAGAHGRHVARNPDPHVMLAEFPRDAAPAALEPVLHELRDALQHLLKNHYGVFVLVHEKRRKLGRTQKEHAKRLLSMMPRERCAA